MIFRIIYTSMAIALSFCQMSYAEKTPGPSHLMVGGGSFNVTKTKPRAMAQLEYRWEINCYHLRPLVAFFVTTDTNFYACGGLAYDIFLGRKVVLTPSFAPGIYYQGHGKRLGFPIEFRSGIEIAYVFHNRGRFGAQFNHISHAHLANRNPGANSLYIYYAIPFPQKQKGSKNGSNT